MTAGEIATRAPGAGTEARRKPARPLATDYAELRRTIRARGLLDPSPRYYALKSALTVGLLVLGIVLALVLTHPVLLLLDAVYMGFASTQIGLIGHDIAHRQVFRTRTPIDRVGVLVGNLAIGTSYSWWTSKHNEHHANPNHLTADPDIDFPIIAMFAEQMASRPRFVRPFLRWQAYYFPFLFPLQAYSFRAHSVRFLLAGRSRFPLRESAALVAHALLYVLLLLQFESWPIAVAFLLVHQASFGVYNASIFAPNHKGMPNMSEGVRLDFLREQVLTARNVRGHPLVDFWYGGLNYQIEHHLFPTMPRNRLGKAQPIVRAFCEERGIEYYETGMLRSYREVITHLDEVGRGVQVPPASS
ncbi:MAG: acyl-CoA desaturase [Chloroflexi bacterium]|nr:acyl-CoA desaturase [Chloroflexota bacterium]